MTHPTLRRLPALALAATSLALPAAAGAHPGVFTTTAQVVKDPATPQVLTPETQYMIANDGYAIVLRESNGAGAPGMVNYKVMPGAFRAGWTKDQMRTYAAAQTPVQPHAVCRGVAALETGATILAWQQDPFYNYIPWQGTAVGIADDPADWIPVVKAATGVDLGALTTVAEFAKTCTDLGGTYQPADTVVTSPTSVASALIADAVKPVTAAKAAAEATAADATARATTAEAALASAQKEVRRLTLAATPLRLALTGAAPFAGLTGAGVPATVSGPPLALVRVRLLTTEMKARQLGLRSRVLGVSTVTSGADGAAAVLVRPGAAAATALAKRRGGLPLILEAASGGRTAGVSAILKAGS